MINSLLIYTFRTSCERKIVFVLICWTGREILGSQFLINKKIDKELVIKFWSTESFIFKVITIVKVCIIRLVHILKKNLCRLFDKYAVARTEHNTPVKSTMKIFSNFVAFSENTKFNTWMTFFLLELMQHG